MLSQLKEIAKQARSAKSMIARHKTEKRAVTWQRVLLRGFILGKAVIAGAPTVETGHS